MTTHQKFLSRFCFFSLSYICGSRLHYLQDSCSMIFQGEGIRIWKCRRCQDLVSGQIIAAAKSISTKLITHIDVKKPYKLCFLMKLCEHISNVKLIYLSGLKERSRVRLFSRYEWEIIFHQFVLEINYLPKGPNVFL